MTRFQFAFFLFILITTSIATPIQTPSSSGSFKVHRIRNEKYIRNGTAEIRKAFRKFGYGDQASRPMGNAAARVNTTKAASNPSLASSDDGETTATSADNQAEFVAPVTIGGQQIVMDFDTGSSDMWVFSTELNADDLSGHTVYNPAQSTTKQTSSNAQKFSVSYGDGSSASGPVVFDTVDIGGATVAQQAIGLPTTVASSFVQDTSSNGLVGLAFSKLNSITPQQQKTFFDNIRGNLSEPVFTANLKAGTVGSYEFGKIDTTAFAGQLAQVPVDSTNGFWEFDSPFFEVNGVKQTMNAKAIADTGTTFILAPDQMVSAYWSQVQSATSAGTGGEWVFDCNEASSLPDLKLACGDSYTATVAGEFMNFAVFSNGPQGTVCLGGLQSSGQMPFAIYGDVFFKSQFVAFQDPLNGSPSLGIAPHA